jgi:hypothetical protein
MGDRTLVEHASLYHFTVATARGWEQDDVATLLRRVAEALDKLGAVDIHDITFHVDWTDEGSWPSMTVYYELDQDDDARDANVNANVAAREVVREAVRDVVREVTPDASNGREAKPEPATNGDAASAKDTAPSPRATPAVSARREGVIAWDTNVFAVDRGAHPFVGRAHDADASGGTVAETREATADAPLEGTGDETVLDLAAAAATEAKAPDVDLAADEAAEADEGERTPEFSVVERVPVTQQADDVLPAAPGSAPAPTPSLPPVNVFPLRMNSSVDKTALRRLKDLWRTTSRRRTD